MRIAVIGSGALGMLWGARLFQTGNKVVLFTRTEKQQRILQRQGLIYTTLHKETQKIPLEAKWIEKYSPKALFDIVFVTVKQHHLSRVIPAIQQISHHESQILFWQNGLGHDEQIARLHDRPWTYAAVTTEGAWKKGPNEVQHTGQGETWVGRFPDQAVQPHSSLLLLLENVKKECDLSIRYDSHILQRIWEKLAVNCVINPLTAIFNMKNGELLSGEYDGQMEGLLCETMEVARHQGIQFDFAEMMKRIRQVCQKTANNYSSMLQDIQKGARTEIDFINGIVVKLGLECQIPTPLSEQMVRLIHEKEKSFIMLGNAQDES